ncbi:hypothetical protein [Lignipirellula cremea]|uniref:Uncharacterized protein n=1 Tax=Lignipirellula cremea TaxID=2528010 RepID=A0A518E1P5_9BACT|nr:hypothetical protein [Lignipirellula cremea]QDU97991.1 hypothetical protein Pla8534_58510 [Lignipirellula cremea]
MPDERFWRDASGRLTFNLPGVGATDYPGVCRDLSDALGLVPAGEIVIGPEQMFWDFQRGDQLVSLDWDIWMDFIVVAKSEEAEPLVGDVAAWLRASPWATANDTA